MSIEFPRALWDELEDEFDLRSDYSGRGMYGRVCIGLTGDVGDLLRFVARVAVWNVDTEEGTDLVADLADRVRSDSMGRDAIYYFPGVELQRTDGDDDVDAADAANHDGPSWPYSNDPNTHEIKTGI